ncbi:MAG: Gfo/Idh/MocA family oxidoreductase [Phycisphaerae bacterium]|jgi:predicted dehydrogenase
MTSSEKRTTRRQFLRVSGALLAAPYFVPATALGRGVRRAPSERLTMGFIGVGNMGGGHLGYFLNHEETQVVAICDVKQWQREAAGKRVEEHYAAETAAGRFKGVALYNEFEELLARRDIDVVLIAVPDHWHTLVATAACAAGKDVYCEKPLTLTVREAEQMVHAARRYDRVFQTGSQQRSSENFRFACELVRNGRIGRIQTVHVNIGMPSTDKVFKPEPVPEGLDWERWLGPAPWQPYNPERCSGNYSGGWRYVRDYSGGMTTDWGAHHFDIAQWALGMDGSGPVEFIPPDGSEGSMLTMVYANGVRLYRGGKVNGILFTGTDGKIEVNRGYLKTWPEEIIREPTRPEELHLYDSPGHQQDWLNCVRWRRRPICDVAIGASSVTLCHLANIACWLGRPIKWDPERREIIGDEAAARWLDRPKRAPWRLYP